MRWRINLTFTIDDITDLYMMLIEASAEKIAGEVFNASENNYKVIEIAEMAKEVVGFENGLIPDYENT